MLASVLCAHAGRTRLALCACASRKSGALPGAVRACRADQVLQEVSAVLAMLDEAYRVFG